MDKIVLLEKIHASAVENLKAQGYSNIVQVPRALAGAELIDALSDADAVGIRSNTHMTAEVLHALPRLRTIGCFCIGTNQVDLNTAAALGIPVFNAPYSNTRSVAELVIAQAILLLRRIPEKNARSHRGIWDKSATGAFETRGKLLGIIGYGNIGAQVGILAESVGMRVCYYDPESKLPLGNARPMPLEELLSQADAITLHVPGGASTTNLINAERIALMRPSAVLINASRGGVVDIDALNAALRGGKLAGAALDVYPVEPRSEKEEFITPLRGLENVIMTPHIGGSTEAGVIARMNALFAESGLNIVAQHLQTRGPIGYAVTDVDAPIDKSLMKKLCGESATTAFASAPASASPGRRPSSRYRPG